MDEKRTKTITVVLAGRPYPLKVSADDEAAIRRIVKEVNEKINNFQLTYADRDKQDCLSMAVLTYAVDLYKARQSADMEQHPDLPERLAHIDQLLDQYLH